MDDGRVYGVGHRGRVGHLLLTPHNRPDKANGATMYTQSDADQSLLYAVLQLNQATANGRPESWLRACRAYVAECRDRAGRDCACLEVEIDG